MLAAAISVVEGYGLIDVTDDALVQPVINPEPARLDGEDDAAFIGRREAWAKKAAAEATEWRRKYDLACETGNWDGMLVEGKAPTVFRIRQVPMTQWDSFRRVASQLGDAEQMTLAFRLGVERIDNLGIGIEIKRGPYVDGDGRKVRPFGDVLSEDVPNRIALAPGGRDVVHRIGLIVLGQRGAPLGK